MNEDVRIRIIAEAITDAAVKSLHDLTRAEKELIGSVDSAKNALKSESDELNKQAGIIGGLENKLTDLKLARKRSLDLDEIKKYNKEIASTEQEISKLTGSTQKSASAFQNLGKMLIGFIAVDKLIDMGKSLLTMTIETDRLQAAMRNAVDSSEDYAKSLAFLNKLSDDYGQNVNVLTKSYTSFVASSKSSNLSLEERQRIYASVVKAGSALKLSNDSIEGSLTALSQMFSKGNVQAEELRGQLGERLPGAFDMAAKAMGVSTMELNKMLEKGEVLAVDLLPKLATELDKTYGDKAKSNLETVGGAWNRLTNAVISYSSKINEATGFTKGIASVFNSLADNFSTVVKVVAAATAGFVTYQIAAKSSAVTSAALSLALKAKNLIIGESIVAYMALGGNVSRLSAAQLTAAASARTFNNVMLSTPWGVAITAAAALSGAYLIYRNRVNEANEEQARLSKEMADLKAPIVEQTTKFNYLANEILRGNLSVEEQIATLNKLKAKYPEILKGVTSLSEAERILKENKIKTSAQYDYRQKKLDELKAEFPNILKGITTVEEAEKSLGNILSIVNGEYEKRIQLAVNAYKSEETEKALEKARQGYVQLQDLADKASKNTTTLGYGANGSAMAVTVESEADRIQKKADNAKKVMEQLMRQLDNYKSKSDNISKSLILNYEKEEEAAKKTVKDLTEKQKKELEAREKLIDQYGSHIAKKQEELGRKMTNAEVKNYVERIKYMGDHVEEILVLQKGADKEFTGEQLKALRERLDQADKAREKELKALDKHQRAYLKSILKGNKEEQKETKELYEVQKKTAATQLEYLNKVNYLRIVANAKSLKDLQDAEKQYNADQLREQMRAADLRIKEVQAEIKQLETLDKVRGTDSKAQRTKLYTELEKLQKEYNSASIALGKQHYSDREAELKQVEDKEKLTADIIFEAKRDGLNAQLIAQKNFGIGIEKLTDEQLKALILYLDAERKALDKQTKWREWTIQDTFATVNAIADAALRVFNEAIDEKLERANTSTERALLENKRMWTNWAAQIGNVAQAWTKSMADGIVATVSWAAQGIANLFTASKRKAKAELEDLKAYYDTILSDWRDFMTENGDDIESLYNTLLKVQRTAVEYNRELSQYDPKFIIENELARARQINETYNLALSREQEWFDKQIKHVNDVYNAEVKRINDVYDLQQRLADQQFGAASNAIRMAQAQSLLGLITNEESKESIANEYSSKLAEIQNIFSLADKQIIEGMGAAEVEAINAAKEAREEAIAALNNWYIKELEYVAESEGQKRKEYSETEKIRMQAEEDLDLLRHQKTIDDIERNKKKNEELLGQKQLLDYSIAQLEQVHADNIVAINKRKDEAIQASWEIVREAVIRGYDEMISAAEMAYKKGALTLEQYRQMIAEVESLRGAVNANGINIPAERDADYRRWLNDNKLVDNDTNRLTYLTNAGNWGNPYKFASGTESVPLGNNPKGIDTVPALLTEGERVLTAEQNKAIGNISNWDLVKLAQLSPINGIPSFNVDPAHYQLIAEANALRNMGNTMDLMPLLGEIASVKEAIKGLPIQQFNITENGISKTIKKQNSIVEYHQKRYGV